MSHYVSWFGEIGREVRPHVGGKAAGLGELMRAGITVPLGFVVRTRAFERLLADVEGEQSVRREASTLNPADLESIRAFSQSLRRRLDQTPFPQDVLEEVCAAHAELCGVEGDTPVAIRSSATTEDTTEASFAGLQDTFLWVRGPSEMLAKLRSCWASLYSTEAISYRRERGFTEAGVAMAVIVQRMVDARTAGVMFTRSPTTGDRSVVVIEAAWGLGSAVAGGEVTPDRWVIDKVTRQISSRTISVKAIQHVPVNSGGIQRVPVAEDLRNIPSLSDAELQALADIARRVERHHGCPQDVEWAVDWRRNQIFVLQCRPETVWSSNDRIPITHAAKNPLTHVMMIFGGRPRPPGEAVGSKRGDQ